MTRRQELFLSKYKQTLSLAPPPLEWKKGTYFNTSLSWRLLCLWQFSGHLLLLSEWVPFHFPKFSIQTLKLQDLAQNLSYNRALQPQRKKLCAQWKKLTISLHSCWATFYGAIFGRTLSKHWQEGAISGVICDLSSYWWFYLLRWGRGLFLKHTQIITLKDALQETHRRFNSPSTHPSIRLYLNHHFSGDNFQEDTGLYKLSFYNRCMGSVSKVNGSFFYQHPIFRCNK